MDPTAKLISLYSNQKLRQVLWPQPAKYIFFGQAERLLPVLLDSLSVLDIDFSFSRIEESRESNMKRGGFPSPSQAPSDESKQL